MAFALINTGHASDGTNIENKKPATYTQYPVTPQNNPFLVLIADPVMPQILTE
jgi:hypothetical protein